jgi:flagellar biosynthesis/type III secretory pathway M-ring protein FliF/YscJ
VEIVVMVALLVIVLVVVASPLRPGRAEAAADAEAAEAQALEAARDAKYREIREAELDFRTGKLSEGDWRIQDRQLRREAVDLLRQLDEIRGEPGPAAS